MSGGVGECVCHCESSSSPCFPFVLTVKFKSLSYKNNIHDVFAFCALGGAARLIMNVLGCCESRISLFICESETDTDRARGRRSEGEGERDRVHFLFA